MFLRGGLAERDAIERESTFRQFQINHLIFIFPKSGQELPYFEYSDFPGLHYLPLSVPRHKHIVEECFGSTGI